MAWRVLVRWSLEGDKGSKVRNGKIVPELEDAGLEQRGSKKKTATWENESADPDEVVAALSNVLKVLAKKTNKGAAGRLDHLWVYIDKAK
jgi:hypothetical protein